jgi:hypothetical protein
VLEPRAEELESAPVPSWLTTSIVVGIGLVYAVIALRRGPVFSADSARYSHWADLLVASHFNYIAWSSSADWVVPPLSYAGFVTVVALCKLLLGSAWAYGVVALNLTLATLTAWMVLRLVERLTASRLLVVAAGVAFLAAFELWLWIPYVLSDVSFMFLTFSAFYVLGLDALRDGRGPRWRGAATLALAVLALLYRPAGLPLAIWVFIALVFGRRLQSTSVGVRMATARWSALTLMVLIAVAVGLDAALMANPAIWPFPFLSGWIHELSHEYNQGVVIFGRPTTFHSSPSGLLDYVWLNLDRLRSFFVFSADGFSRPHNLANAVFFLPVYAGWAVAVVSLLRARSTLNWSTWWATAFGTLFVVLFWVFHSLQYIDYDWRYRLPCLPMLIMLGAIGWNEILNQLRARWRRSRQPSWAA